MSEKKLLGYSDGAIVPYVRSSSMAKDIAAELCIGSASQHITIATWATARACMVEVLESALRKGKKQVPISTLKRLFRSRFHVELSETALGYTKLSSLLQDHAFHDIASVRLLEQGFVVLPNEKAFAQQALDVLKQLPVVNKIEATPQLSLALPCRNMVRHTFIQISSTATGSAKRAHSVPKDVGSLVVDMDEPSVYSDDDSTDVGSGMLSPTLTASPAWSPRRPADDVELPCPSCWPLQELSQDPFDMWRCDASSFAVAMDPSLFEMALGTWDASASELSLTAEASLGSMDGPTIQIDNSMAQCDYAVQSASFGGHIGSWADASSPTTPIEGMYPWTLECVNHEDFASVQALTKPILCLSHFLQYANM